MPMQMEAGMQVLCQGFFAHVPVGSKSQIL